MKNRLTNSNIKFLVIALWIVGSGLVFGLNTASGSRMTPAEYTDWIARTYDFRFGEDKPFAPSNAATVDGKFIPGEDFISAERCAKCHTDVHPQWKQSAHANSFREPFYQKNVNDLIAQKDIAFTRHCESCHNPAALFSGALTKKAQFKNRPFDNEGVSCIACHSIEAVNGKGIGGYTMGQPSLLTKEDGTKMLDASDQDILNDVESHRRAMIHEVTRKPEFCAACHKSQVPRELNDYKFLRAFAVGDELQMSSFSKESPHPFYVRNKETCNSCHMPNEASKFYDVSAKDGNVASHRWAASNTAIPAFYGFTEQLAAVDKFLADDKLGIDIFALRRQAKDSKKEQFIAPVNRSKFEIKTGDTLTADVVITNKNIGHSFPPELRDFYEAYVEFTVTDAASGKSLFKSGYIKPDGYLDEFAHNYKTYLVKADGSANELHHIWQTRVIPQNLAIPSGRSDVARYRFSVPTDLSGQIKLAAKLKYRRFTRVYSDYALGKAVDLPIVEMAKTEKVLNIGDNSPEEVNPKAIPDWRRWNNYGIALLDGRQFAASADAFARVIDLDDKYRPFALTNKALALMEIDEWGDAENLIAKALELDPANFRALFQRGRIMRVAGKLADAETDFRKVNEAFPRDRLSLQQLGELSKIKRDYQSAQSFYEQILKIDPEDTGAHYNMMLVYSKLGMKPEAARESKIFADLKDDPRTTALAGTFLENNPAVGRRSLPYYINDLKPFQSGLERTDYLALTK